MDLNELADRVEQIARDLTTGQVVNLGAIAISCGRLRADDEFPGLPPELLDNRFEGGLFPQCYLSPLGLSVLARTKALGAVHTLTEGN